MKPLLVRLWNEEQGQALEEYGLLVTLIALAAIASMNSVATQIVYLFLHAATSFAVSAAS